MCTSVDFGSQIVARKGVPWPIDKRVLYTWGR
jgi:hypothetical protein